MPLDTSACLDAGAALPADAAVDASAAPERLRLARRAYTVRHVPLAAAARLLAGPGLRPRAGDLVLARVLRLGLSGTLEGVDGRQHPLQVGDELLLAYGAPHEPGAYGATLPAELGPCQLAGAGGVAAQVAARRGGELAPTELLPLGLLADATGRRLNLADFCWATRPDTPCKADRPTTIASLGTSPQVGKTMSAASLVRGLVRAGLQVGAAKITGTASGHEPGLLRAAGAALVLDFTDFGHACTQGLETNTLLTVLQRVQLAMAQAGMQALVVEVAGGVMDRETARLLRAPAFARRVDASLLSSAQPLTALAGLHGLHQLALPVLALAGTMTRTPVACNMAAAASGLPALRMTELCDASLAQHLLQEAAAWRLARNTDGAGR